MVYGIGVVILVRVDSEPPVYQLQFDKHLWEEFEFSCRGSENTHTGLQPNQYTAYGKRFYKLVNMSK